MAGKRAEELDEKTTYDLSIAEILIFQDEKSQISLYGGC